MKRSTFLKTAGALSGFVLTGNIKVLAKHTNKTVDRFRRKIIKCEIGESVRINNSFGDLWSNTWAPDNSLYCISDDTQGFDRKCNSNIALTRLTGDSPKNLTGENINCMEYFGTMGSSGKEKSCDGCMENWKGCSIICVDNILYVTVSRHRYGTPETNLIQNAFDSTIIKSMDYGKTWVNLPDLSKPMFPGHDFATPFFIEYGKNGKATDPENPNYIYAVSSKGSWNNSTGMILGRVRRNKLALLNASDWEFPQHFPYGKPVWGKRHDTAAMSFFNPGKASMTGVHYNEALGLYIMPQWYYPNLHNENLSTSARYHGTVIELYQSYTPWGPWELFAKQDFGLESWYNPSIPAKFISSDGKNFWLIVGGSFTYPNTEDMYRPFYRLHAIPVFIETNPK